MKLAATALILGCTALVCKFAVQPNFSLTAPPDVQQALQRMGLTFFPLTLTQPAQLPIWDRPKAPKPGPDKAAAILMIHAAAAKHGVDAAFVKSIVAAESNFNYAALSPKGAIGFMQLMPATAEELGADPSVPEQNIDAGTRYLRQLMDRYEKRSSSLKRVIAAYNAGPGAVDRYRGVPPFHETRRYVARVMGYLHQFQSSGKRT